MKTLFFLIVLSSNLIFSQNSFIATYKVDFDFESSEEVNDIVKKYKSIAIRNAKKIEFILQGNNKISKFSVIENLMNDDKNVKITLAYAGYINDGLFQDLVNGFLLRNNPQNSRLASRNEFLIRSPLFNDWELVEGTKIISGKKCFKAKGKIESNNEAKRFKYITAWYCPEINFNSGPLGFGNLPGLIVQLKVDETVYSLKNIKTVDDSQIDFKLPDQGNEVTDKEFYEIFEERMADMNN